MLDHARELATVSEIGCTSSWIQDNTEHDHQDVYGLDTTSHSNRLPLSLSKRCPAAASHRIWIWASHIPPERNQKRQEFSLQFVKAPLVIFIHLACYLLQSAADGKNC
jgi:hypothetical protein